MWFPSNNSHWNCFEIETCGQTNMTWPSASSFNMWKQLIVILSSKLLSSFDIRICMNITFCILKYHWTEYWSSTNNVFIVFCGKHCPLQFILSGLSVCQTLSTPVYSIGFTCVSKHTLSRLTYVPISRAVTRVGQVGYSPQAQYMSGHNMNKINTNI